MWNFEGLLEQIKSADIITIFRHVHPDCDAVGSQFGLKNWIKENWPEKQVYALGNEYCTQGNCWPESDSCSIDVIRKSLALIVDTANEERIDDERYESARRIIKIDHHPNRSPYGNQMYVFERSAATCEILAEFLKQCSEQDVSQKTAEYLFRGILTDTLGFKTSNTREHTLTIAGWLAQFSVRIPELNRELFEISYDDFRFDAMLRDTGIFTSDGRMVYRIVSESEAEDWSLTPQDVKNFIQAYGDISGVEIFAIFCQTPGTNPPCFEGSLRSKTVRINDIAEKYRGGGHPNACGVRGITDKELPELLKELHQRIFD